MARVTSDSLTLVHFDSKDTMNEAIVQELKGGDTLLVKGSRGLKLEETVSYVQDYLS